MQTKTKPVYKRLIFWQITIAAAVVLALGICLGVMLRREPPQTAAFNSPLLAQPQPRGCSPIIPELEPRLPNSLYSHPTK